MKPGSAKAKGRSLQRWVCKKIAELTGFEWGKDRPIESRPMGQSGADVRLESQVLDIFPFSVECKFQERWSVPKWIAQAKANEAEGRIGSWFASSPENLPLLSLKPMPSLKF